MNHASLEALHVAITQGDADQALRIEKELYLSVVKQTETEEHYRSEFEKFSDGMRALGESRRGIPATGDGVCFFFHTNSPLAHAGLVREAVRERGKRKVIACVFDGAPEPMHQFLGVPTYALDAEAFDARFERLREIMTREGCGTLVWVSAPLYADYAMATRIAERQTFWAMRFHPVTSPHIDGYLTQGRRSEQGRTINGRAWRCVHAPWSVTKRAVDPLQAERYRLQLGHEIVLGTVAREEKIAHPQYLETVATVLRELPQAVFIWTGKKERADIRNFFLETGLARQQRFVGWVEPDKFICLLDVFLETFPQGGTMTALAMEHGVPVVAMNSPAAFFGWLEEIPRGAGVAGSTTEYAALAIQFALDRVKRADAISAGALIAQRERDLAPSDARRIMGAL